MGMKSWTEVKGGRTSWRDNVEFLVLPNGKWMRVRPVGGVFCTAVHWFRTERGKNFANTCANFNPDTESWEDRGCPACEAKIRASRVYLQNVIDRKLQKQGDPNPVRLWEIGASMAIAVRKSVGLLNEDHYEDESEMYGPEHAKKGCDLRVQYDKTQPSTSRYSCQIGTLSALTSEEKEYEYYDIEDIYQHDSLDDLAQSVEKHVPEDGDGRTQGGKKSSAPKKRMNLDAEEDINVVALDDDDDSPVSFAEDFDEEEEDKPRVRKGKNGTRPSGPSPSEKKVSSVPECFGEYNKKDPDCKKCPGKFRFDCIDES